MCGLFGVGEAEDGAVLHAQDEVEDEEGLFAQRTGHVVLLKNIKQIYTGIYKFNPRGQTARRLLPEGQRSPPTVSPWGKSKPPCVWVEACGVPEPE